MGHPGLGTALRPLLHHLVGILLKEFFDRSGRPAVGVAFPQHRIDRRTEDHGKSGLERPLRVVLGFFRIVGDIVAFGL